MIIIQAINFYFAHKMKNIIQFSFKLLSIGLLIGWTTSCDKLTIDDTYSRHNYSLKMNPSVKEIQLNEQKEEEIALTLDWQAAKDLGLGYSTSYLFEIDCLEGSKGPISEYVAQDEVSKSYTHGELQTLLVEHWERPTGATSTLQIRITANTEGPRVVIPEVETSTILIKTFGPAPFLADRLFMKGTAAGDDSIEMTKSGNANVFTYTGELAVGDINFPIIFGQDQDNVVSPLTDGEQASAEASDIRISKNTDAASWRITESGSYRVTVDLANKRVTVIPSGDVLDLQGLFLAGSAVGAELQIQPTLENDHIYAFRGELKAGSLYLPILFEGERALSIVPSNPGSSAIADGVTTSFAQSETAAAAQVNHWQIEKPGVYRIVVNAENKDIAIYSPETDLKSKVVSWNNTVLPQNPFTAPITELWMYGGFNDWKSDGNGFSGFHNDFKLVQSLADPNIFVYKGAELPRSTVADTYDKKSYTAPIRFTVSNIHNNVYAFGSTAPAVRNVSNGYLIVNSNAPQQLIEGQGDNRYAFFCFPAGTNFVVVDVKNLTVVFDKK